MQLCLSIKTVFLEQILSGEKNIEYRDLCPFYSSRFCEFDEHGEFAAWKKIDTILFRAGRNANSKKAQVELTGIELLELLDEEGEPTGDFVFALSLGKRALLA